MKPIEFQLFGLSTASLKFSKFLIWFLKSGVSFVKILLHFVITYLEHKWKAKLKEAHLRESKRVSKDVGDLEYIFKVITRLPQHKMKEKKIKK